MLLAGLGLGLGWGDDGRDGRWLARYESARGEVIERYEPDVRVHWRQGAPVRGWPADGFRQRFETCLAPEQPQALTLLLGTEDPTTVWLGEQQIIGQTQGGRYTELRARVQVDGPMPLVVESVDEGGASSVQLWYEDAAGRHSIPARWLRPPRQGRTACGATPDGA